MSKLVKFQKGIQLSLLVRSFDINRQKNDF